jgi:hypothetical protein
VLWQYIFGLLENLQIIVLIPPSHCAVLTPVSVAIKERKGSG